MGDIILNEREFEQTAKCIKAVSHPLRLAMVCVFAQGEQTVNEICAMLGTTQPNISQHLAQLHNQGLLKSRKEANRVYYTIADQRLSEIIGMLQEIYCPEENALFLGRAFKSLLRQGLALYIKNHPPDLSTDFGDEQGLSAASLCISIEPKMVTGPRTTLA
jgi:DNA-binding transcriptional ArsR family regulator